MTDAYIYYFTVQDGATGKITRSPRRATLAAIRGIGEPVMESQIIADIAELDSDGFATDTTCDGSPPSSDLANEIRSLQLRADSRDSKALLLNETTEGGDKYMLQLESRELRNQALKLHNERAKSTADASAASRGSPDYCAFEELLAVRQLP